jgi:AmmeMemoRadiSam system protein B
LKPSVRTPAVAGFFYEAEPAMLRTKVRSLLERARRTPEPESSWAALLLPHAGHVYSGGIAAAGVAAVSWPAKVILLGPNHRGEGAGAALSPASAWRTPLGDVPVDGDLGRDLLAACPDLEADAAAHRHEHSLEVLLPFLQEAAPGLSIACVSLGEPDPRLCAAVGDGVAKVVAGREARGERVALVVSSDLNHYLPRRENRAKDDHALRALRGGDPEAFFQTILRREQISMCGVLPATALLRALALLGAGTAEVVAQGDSGDAFGDVSKVVGYASVLWPRTKEAS